MKSTLRLGLLLALVPVWGILAPPVGATYCVQEGSTTTVQNCCGSITMQEVTDGSILKYYIDLRQDARAGGVWIYEESNDVAGLQRGGPAEHGPSVNVSTPAVYLYKRIEPIPPVTSTPTEVGDKDEPVLERKYVAEVDRRYDTCYDRLPGLRRDTNLL